MLDLIRQAFPSADPCLQTITDKQFCIYDHAELKRCVVQTDPDGITHFLVKNPTGHPVHLLAVDGCLMTPSDPTRCDCAIFDTITVCLIEIKTAGNKQKRAAKRKKAEDQLRASILLFREQINFSGEHSIEAYVCLLDSKTFGPCVRSGSISRTLEFERMGVSLFYTNEKEFK
ncbi:MAG: hypothetical protein H7Z72_16165 [Bacteroidetes bacterium]|nr:hypothetical protein [Fibrella sp.]